VTERNGMLGVTITVTPKKDVKPLGQPGQHLTILDGDQDHAAFLGGLHEIRHEHTLIYRFSIKKGYVEKGSAFVFAWPIKKEHELDGVPIYHVILKKFPIVKEKT